MAGFADVRAVLDAERRAQGVPDVGRDVVREFAADGSRCRIVFSRLGADEADAAIDEEKGQAEARGYPVEWKVYGHDGPADLGARLRAADFVAEDVEQVMMLPVDEMTVAASAGHEHDVRRVVDDAGLADYAEIAREIGRIDPLGEREQLAAILRTAPDAMSIHIAYHDGEPVSCGRVHYSTGGTCAELAGGRTKTTHRRRGLFSAVVGARLAEARDRGRMVAFSDALPTSEPILTRHGFRVLTSTQPFVYAPDRRDRAAASPSPTMSLPQPSA